MLNKFDNYINRCITKVFVFILIFTIAMSGIVILKINHLQSSIETIPGQVDKITSMYDIKEGIYLQAISMKNFILTGKQEYLIQFRDYTTNNNKLQKELFNKIRESRKPLVNKLIINYNQYIDYCESTVFPYISKGGKVPAIVEETTTTRQMELVELINDIQSLRQNDTLLIIGNTIENSKNASTVVELFTMLGTVFGVVLSLFFGSRFIRNHKIYSAILNSTRNANITIDKRGFITSINKTAQRLFGLSKSNTNEVKIFDIFGEGNKISIDLPLMEVITSGNGICNLEKVYTEKDGWRSVLNIDVLPLDTTPPCEVLISARDISERKLIEEKLFALTLRDGLTYLYNHSFLKRRLNETVKNPPDNKPVSFILMDIDNFKYYNDRFGHLAGDALLKEFGQLLLSCVRVGDTVGRYGGDEFAVILPDTDRNTVLVMAEKIRSAVEKHPFGSKNLMPTGKFTISVGASIFPDDANDSEELIRLADEAMYRCKRNSKNEVQLYSSALKDFQKELKESQHSLFNLVQMLLGLINAKDKDTYLHLEKVAEYVGLICDTLDLEKNLARDIKLAGFLHDVGKIEVPRNILNKVDPLTVDEWRIIKQHPKWGANLVRSLQSLDNLIPQILHHHERFDGSGYPYGLKGEDIPLGARIIAVADSFDAITNSRSYKRPKNYEEALEEIKRCSGTQFDPKIVEVFVNSFSHHHFMPGSKCSLSSTFFYDLNVC